MDLYLRAVVAYDGTDFSGFQIQSARSEGQLPREPSAGDRDVRTRTQTHSDARTHSDAPRTVQGVLEEALEHITRERIRLVAAGRTDAGVHALGQVVAFTTYWRHPLCDLFRAWNAVLPEDVAILSLCQAQRGFHPRFDAISRAYRYTVWSHPVRNPLLRHTALWEPRKLDVSSMAAALGLLVGEHDFATFGTSPSGQRASTVRRVLKAIAYRPQSGRRADAAHCPTPTRMWGRRRGTANANAFLCARCGDAFRSDVRQPTQRSDAGLGQRADAFRCAVYIDIEANAFLYRMVRSIVGTILQVGRGELALEQFASAFAAKDRSQAGPTAPPHGLCLIAVNY